MIEYNIWTKLLQKQINIFNIIDKLKLINLDAIVHNNHHQKYILCNAEESEPGVFNGRHIMLYNPHKLIEGIAIVGLVVGASVGYIYIRGDFLEPREIMNQALLEAYKFKLLGKNILQSGYNFDLHVTHGAGSYISGEETAMIESIEGKKALPRFTKLFPSMVGLYGCPTAVYNVETLANVPAILDENNNIVNTKMFSISGHVNKPGVYELPLNINFKELLAIAGGVKHNKRLKAVIPGGLYCGVLPADLILSINLDQLVSGGVVVMDESTDMVKVLLRITKFYMDESCGQCSPCREGTGWVYRLINRIYHGQALLKDLAVLEKVINNMENNTICGLGKMVKVSVASFIKHFKPEFIAKIQIGAVAYD